MIRCFVFLCFKKMLLVNEKKSNEKREKKGAHFRFGQFFSFCIREKRREKEGRKAYDPCTTASHLLLISFHGG